MKKLFKMKLALCLTLMLFVSAPSVNAFGLAKSDHPAVASPTANPLTGAYWCGRIGGDNAAWLQFDNNRSGSYGFLNMTRKLKFVSYNSRNRSLILNAYEKGTGKYIGKFVGKYSNERYTGTFTNYKGGKVTFDLALCGALD